MIKDSANRINISIPFTRVLCQEVGSYGVLSDP